MPQSNYISRLFSIIIIMVSVVVLPFLWSCQPKGGQSFELTEIDSLLQVDPDSAWNRIAGYDTTLLRNDNDRHLFSLLLAEGRHKTFRTDTALKAISDAAQYFADRNDSGKAMRAVLYKGICLHNAACYGPAIISFLQGVEMADSADHLYRGKLYNAISESYQTVSDAPQELEYAQKALEEYQKLDSLVFIEDMLLAHGYALCRNNRLDEGIGQMQQVYLAAQIRKDNQRMSDALKNMALGFIWNARNKEANDCLHLLYAHRNAMPLEDDYLELYLNSMISVGAPLDSIDRVANALIISNPSKDLPHCYYAFTGDMAKAYHSLLRDNDEDNAMFIDIESSTVGHDVKVYLDDQRRAVEAKRANLKKIIILTAPIAVFLLCLLAAIMRVIYLEKKRKEKELLYNLELLSRERTELNAYLEELRKNASSLSDDNKKLTEDVMWLKNQQADMLTHESYLIEQAFEDISKLHALYHNQGHTDKAKREILSHLEAQLKYLRDDDALLAAMEGHLNIYHAGLITDIYRHISITPDQRRVVAFLCFHFSRPAVCQILDLTTDNFNSRLYRLRKKLSELGGSRATELLALLGYEAGHNE